MCLSRYEITSHAAYAAAESAAGCATMFATFASAISDWDRHEWDARSRAIVAAALREAIREPRRPQLDRLPCDILHHDSAAVPCGG